MTNPAERAKQVKENVMDLLERFPETRDEDRHLLLRYWTEKDGIAFDYTFPERFMRATSAESITRARRQIQRAGLFLPTEEAAQNRRERAQELRQHYATDQTPAQVAFVLDAPGK